MRPPLSSGLPSSPAGQPAGGRTERKESTADEIVGHKQVEGISYLESDDQGVFAGEEDVHVGDEPVVGDEHESEDEEWRVLEDDVDEDAPDVDGAADLLGLVQGPWLAVLLNVDMKVVKLDDAIMPKTTEK